MLEKQIHAVIKFRKGEAVHWRENIDINSFLLKHVCKLLLVSYAVQLLCYEHR